MNQTTLILLLLFFWIQPLYAQQKAEDLLLKAKQGVEKRHLIYAHEAFDRSKTDSLKTASLNRIASIHFQNDSLESFFRACQFGLEDTRRRHDDWGVARFHYRLGDYYQNQNLFDSAYYHYFQANKGFKGSSDSTEVVKSLLNLSIMSMSIGDYVQSENESVEALQYLNGIKRPKFETSCYNNLGISFVERGNFDRAIYWYTKCLDLAKSDKEYLTIYNNLGVASRRAKQYNQALQYFDQALSRSSSEGLEQYRAMVLDNIGYTKFLVRGDDGLDYMNEGYKLRNDAGNLYGEIVSQLHLAEYYLSKNELHAEDLLKQAHRKAKLIGNTKNELKALRLLSLNFGRTNDLHLYLSLRDSIKSANENLRFQHASIRFETKEKELKNLQLEKVRSENELALIKQKRFTFYLIISIVGLIVLLMLVYAWFRVRRKRLEMQSRIRVLESRFEEQDKISYLLHQDIANDLLLKIDELDNVSQKEEVSDLPPIIDDLESVYKRTVEISRDLGRYEFNKRPFERNIRFLVSSFNDDSTQKIHVLGYNQLDEIQIGKTILYESYLILKELLSNIKKHSKASYVEIRFSNEKGIYSLMCSDNGEGVSKTEGRGIGLWAMRERVEKHLNGKFDVHSNNPGTHVEIQIPIR